MRDDGYPSFPEATGELALPRANEDGCEKRFVQVDSQVEEAVLRPGEPPCVVKVKNNMRIHMMYLIYEHIFILYAQ